MCALRDYNTYVYIFCVCLIVIAGHTRNKTGLGKRPKRWFIRIISLSSKMSPLTLSYTLITTLSLAPPTPSDQKYRYIYLTLTHTNTHPRERSCSVGKRSWYVFNLLLMLSIAPYVYYLGAERTLQHYIIIAVCVSLYIVPQRIIFETPKSECRRHRPSDCPLPWNLTRRVVVAARKNRINDVYEKKIYFYYYNIIKNSFLFWFTFECLQL